MKKTMKKLSAMLSAAMLAASAAPVSANALKYFGTATEDIPQGYQLLGEDDGGMFEGGPVYYNGDLYDQYNMRFLTPGLNDALFFVVRKGLNTTEAADKAAEIIRRYYPDVKLNDRYAADVALEQAPEFYTSDYDFLLRVRDETARTSEAASGIMHDLAAAGLISEFYSWGQTAYSYDGSISFGFKDGQYSISYSGDYVKKFTNKGYLSHNISVIPADGSTPAAEPDSFMVEYKNGKLTCLYPENYIAVDNDQPKVPYDTSFTIEYKDGEYTCVYPASFTAEAMQSFLIEQNLNCSVQSFESTYEYDYVDGDPMNAVSTSINVTLDGERTVQDMFQVAVALYKEFGCHMWSQFIPEWSYVAIGKNELAMPGDVNLDCVVDVSDAVLLAKFVTGDSDAAICDQGKANAAFGESSEITLDDVTEILKIIVHKA
ncbi:MAG: hypothetical protein IJL32_01080 [Oscillospiraceae bacterium]|nr:hypothetical protein [Oscillospiraceae bacterium]